MVGIIGGSGTLSGPTGAQYQQANVEALSRALAQMNALREQRRANIDKEIYDIALKEAEAQGVPISVILSDDSFQQSIRAKYGNLLGGAFGLGGGSAMNRYLQGLSGTYSGPEGEQYKMGRALQRGQITPETETQVTPSFNQKGYDEFLASLTTPSPSPAPPSPDRGSTPAPNTGGLAIKMYPNDDPNTGKNYGNIYILEDASGKEILRGYSEADISKAYSILQESAKTGNWDLAAEALDRMTWGVNPEAARNNVKEKFRAITESGFTPPQPTPETPAPAPQSRRERDLRVEPDPTGSFFVVREYVDGKPVGTYGANGVKEGVPSFAPIRSKEAANLVIFKIRQLGGGSPAPAQASTQAPASASTPTSAPAPALPSPPVKPTGDLTEPERKAALESILRDPAKKRAYDALTGAAKMNMTTQEGERLREEKYRADMKAYEAAKAQAQAQAPKAPQAPAPAPATQTPSGVSSGRKLTDAEYAQARAEIQKERPNDPDWAKVKDADTLQLYFPKSVERWFSGNPSKETPIPKGLEIARQMGWSDADVALFKKYQGRDMSGLEGDDSKTTQEYRRFQQLEKQAKDKFTTEIRKEAVKWRASDPQDKRMSTKTALDYLAVSDPNGPASKDPRTRYLLENFINMGIENKKALIAKTQSEANLNNAQAEAVVNQALAARALALAKNAEARNAAAKALFDGSRPVIEAIIKPMAEELAKIKASDTAAYNAQLSRIADIFGKNPATQSVWNMYLQAAQYAGGDKVTAAEAILLGTGWFGTNPQKGRSYIPVYGMGERQNPDDEADAFLRGLDIE